MVDEGVAGVLGRTELRDYILLQRMKRDCTLRRCSSSEKLSGVSIGR